MVLLPSGCAPQDAGAGLLAAAMIAVVPGYISRSVAGSYDNEGEFVALRTGKPLRSQVPISSMGRGGPHKESLLHYRVAGEARNHFAS